MTTVTLTRAGPGITVQDLGRRGYISQGLSRGGAADRTALLAAAALLRQEVTAALELPPSPLALRANGPLRFALTGSERAAQVEGNRLAWNGSHRLAEGETLTLAAGTGGYAYVSFGGGLATPIRLGSRAAHLAAGIGAPVETGDELLLGPDGGDAADLVLEAERTASAALRLLPSAHTALFPEDQIARLQETTFTRDPRGNRQGIRLTQDGAPFGTEGQLSLLSEIARPGDIQITGDGSPMLLGPECQTTGGYPRIGCLHPDDLPRAMQTPPGATLRLSFVPLDEATWQGEDDILRDMRARTAPRIRDPHDIRDLGAYQLISGVTTGETA
ncbi:Allophanate hydrolase subunit 2 [Palleronia marisminoris]|uniref:KipI antagonist n=1 Tax=Palleronia marisminoris TaxID=315423 RepID=A0A1Y5RX63_9RHOB|nr:biotin-dependent carboxyltransferase family protein [Palleronia marisminoris]SFG44732.1 Allophanate hydrolase subunit 2 [Palleronia marisminoris]SLN26484.1 KipI antagonist [Palleronia marisminoris]